MGNEQELHLKTSAETRKEDAAIPGTRDFDNMDHLMLSYNSNEKATRFIFEGLKDMDAFHNYLVQKYGPDGDNESIDTGAEYVEWVEMKKRASAKAMQATVPIQDPRESYSK